MYKIVKISNRYHQRTSAPKRRQGHVLQTTCCDRIHAAYRKILKHLGNIYRSSTFNRNTADCWAKRVQLPKWESRAPWFVSLALPVTAVRPEMLLSADTTICQDQYITANKQCTIFQTFSSVLVTSSMTLDIQSCVSDGYLMASELGKKWMNK